MSREILDQHRILWEKKKVTRYLYNRWYRRIEGELAPLGPTVELGAGTGNFKEFMPSSLSSDLVFCEWLDVVHDAMALPYGDGAVGNFVLIDSIHHVKRPVAVLDEMHRCLKDGGRIVILDVYISPFSYLYYNFLHKEDVNLSVDVFNMEDDGGEKAPFSSNQAIATLLFFRGLERFKARFPGLRPVRNDVMEFLLYPLSGGFEGRQLVPYSMVRLVDAVDRWSLKLLGAGVAARCLVVLEKAGKRQAAGAKTRRTKR